MGEHGGRVSEIGGRSEPRPIHERCFEYALRAVRLFHYLDGLRDGATTVIAKQFLRSATSVGANVEEAQAAESRADFIHKMGIAQKESRESLYLLRLLHASGTIPEERMAPLIQESREILAIISKIIINSKRGR